MFLKTIEKRCNTDYSIKEHGHKIYCNGCEKNSNNRNGIMKKMMVAICIIVSFFIISCTEDGNPEATWTLVSIDEKEQDYEREDGTLKGTITISLMKRSETEYGITGFSGVNHFNGVATISGRNLSVSPLAVTMMIGAPENQMLEDRFLKILQEGGRLSFEKDDGEMYLTIENKGNNTELEFVQTLLENTAWNISMYNVGNAVTNVPSSVAGVSLAFSADGKVYGSTGANNIMGTYAFTKEGSLSFGTLGTTRMAAPNQETRDFEVALLQLLEEVTMFDMSGDTLTLRSDTGETLLVYKK